MKFLIVLSLSFTLVVNNVVSQPRCHENEEWSDCGNPCHEACPLNNLPCIVHCTEMCVCKENHRRNSSGHCIPDAECSVVSLSCLDINERYRLFNPCNEMCNAQNCPDIPEQWGCFCKKGYKRDENQIGLSKCIPESTCPLSNEPCNIHLQAYLLSSEEERVCGGVDTTQRYGCYCTLGFKFDPAQNKCVHSWQC